MPRGYDAQANEAWERAKVLAEKENRSLTLSDLWWGIWATIPIENLAVTLPETIQHRLKELRGKRAVGKVRVSEEVKALDSVIQRKCQGEGRKEASIWDMLIALAENPTDEVQKLMQEWGLKTDTIRSLVQSQLATRKPPEILPPQVLEALRPFVINLTELAAQGQLSPAYERDEERQAILMGLLSKTKRNVALVGPAGVGKTKMAEDLALRIYQGEIPQLEGCIVLSLNLVALRAGTSVHGELEKRFQALREVLEKYGDRIILFIDELHTIVGTPVGGTTLDLANALKPLLASGKIRCIGATTRQEYVQYIEADRALARRFQVVTIQEPSREVMERILEKVKGDFESHHRVVYPPETLKAILDLSERFLPMRHFPDKAIELLDLSGAYAALKQGEQLPRTVTPDDVKAVLAKRYQIPMDILEKISVRQLARHLGEVVVGQETALQILEQAVMTALATEERKGPRAIWLFVGPSGVGKTLTAQTLARWLCQNEKAFLELDLSQIVRRYHLEASDLDTLIGVRPPYVGWERGGVLTNHVMEFPRSLILVRGLEQASPEVHHLFESIFEKGICEDGRGQQVYFGETFFVLAYDLDWERERRLGFSLQEEPKEVQWQDAEWLNRRLQEGKFPAQLLRYVQAVIPFAPLTQEALREIARRKLEALKEAVHQREGKTLEYDELLLDWLTAKDDGKLSVEELEQRIEQWVEMPVYRLKSQEGWGKWRVIRLKVSQSELRPEPITPRLLVVDDVPDFYETLKASHPEWQWHYAATAEEAAQVIEREQPHLVLVNTCQSEIDPNDIRGLDILRQLKERFPQQVIVMVTSQPLGFETTREAFRRGAYDYLWKPPEDSLLQQIVNLLVEREERERQLAYQQTLLKRRLSISYEVQSDAEQAQVLYKMGGDSA